MVLRVNILIYMYMVLCVCMLAFNAAYAGRRKWSDLHRPGKIKKWKERIGILIESGQPVNSKETKELMKTLAKPAQISLFYKAQQELWQEGKGERFLEWAAANRRIFITPCEKYSKKSVMYKAFYAFLIGQYKLCGTTQRDPFVRFMLQLVTEHSIYCRENALQALYANAPAAIVIRAYQLMVRQEIEHSSKLVTDGLLAFAGDRVELAGLLWDHWNEFPPFYQTAFINFIRLVTGGFGRRFLPLLREETDREVQFAVIRYYRRYHYEEAGPVLCRMVMEWNIDDWEFAALAAASLENYPGEDSIRALIQGMYSSNWYIRDNASDSLVRIGRDSVLLQEILQGTDRYAKDMLQYKLDQLGKALDMEPAAEAAAALEQEVAPDDGRD
ncbi:HEAT repeat domain-containing protein [Lachnospiraceae bacterium ASD3451]|uniref:HEAT repeat domain-containing protein n=1 Tax=Diplocloster agilis TaxID=2850323 RepID=UPI001DDE00E5|nr:HEAT repeat domain-containing protein [Diplocloster agilis]MBU9745352.1 HEAT repeat domain-containing protein [Diplocloster agilis]